MFFVPELHYFFMNVCLSFQFHTFSPSLVKFEGGVGSRNGGGLGGVRGDKDLFYTRATPGVSPSILVNVNRNFISSRIVVNFS